VLLLVHLYADRVSPKYEKAAMRWLERYLTKSARTLPSARGHSAGGLRVDSYDLVPKIR